ncbi:uncharacterized protein HD556DRAFT_1310554 [Suillus plorans]|uniref:Uncharacterized protein n=1 Tax=Suillus plorans TaxID=116603 RepID=A0A9P7DE61_9AGAM|nr:uncharacterized protein HD556DRAFT_1310554 [Suillus plorans]KAG1790541.1 hypothetical protein HD556DRAFT_1310554 [Suillus plorans]
MTQPNNTSVVEAPLISSALSITVFCIAAMYMLKYAPQHSPGAADSFMQDVFSGAANHLHINHVPWHVANAGAHRHCSYRPVHTSWVNLGKALEKQPMGQRNAGPTNSAVEASNKAQASAQAPWTVQSIKLQSLPQFISRDSLPDEFSLNYIEVEAQEMEPFICQIYEWVFSNFNAQKSMHKIALLAGIYISKILPDIFTDEAYNAKPRDGEHMITQALRVLPWNPNRSTQKGCRLEKQFIAMVPAYIIAVYEMDSPLRKCFADHQGKSFPLRWNSKNSNKGIGSLLMMRLGLAKAKGQRFWKGGVFN